MSCLCCCCPQTADSCALNQCVLDKGVDYIKEVRCINPLPYSYTTIKRFTACLQMFSPLSTLILSPTCDLAGRLSHFTEEDRD